MTDSNVAQEFSYDGHLLLFQAETNRLYTLNHTGRLIWQLRKRDMNLETMVDSLVSRFDVTRQQAMQDIKDIIASWQQVGLLESPVVTDQCQHQCFPSYRTENKLNVAQSLQPHNISCFNIAGRGVKFVCDDQKTMTGLSNILNHLQTTEHGSVDLTVSVCHNNDHFSIAVNGIHFHSAESQNDVIAWVLFELVAHSYRDRDCMAVLHSAAVCHNDSALLFPGSRGMGKSTLIAALQEQGFDYLCDDVCPLIGEQGQLVPVPMSQSLKSNSWSVLAHISPSLAEQPGKKIFGRSIKFLRPATGNSSIWNQAWPVGMLIFPEFQPRSQLNYQTLTPLQALKLIIASGSLFGEDISRLLKWLENTPCYSLSYSSLDDATEWIRSKVDEQDRGISQDQCRMVSNGLSK